MWYQFDQNNSGGSFDVDKNLCHRLFIEGDDYEQAKDKAIELGVYFDGCELGMDCPCCGDRWSDGEEITFPFNFGGASDIYNDIETLAQMYANKFGRTTPDARIFYKDGTIKEIKTKEAK